jgi:NDP-sugar pyrophosphorylase family protein
MILAAGLGTRLRPLTDTTPKALVTVGGVTMLERIARRLIAAGVDRLIVNVHHHADQVARFIDERHGFGIDVRISPEEGAPLETGGGVLHARPHFRQDAPFFLHNVDVITDAPLEAMYRAHLDTGALATLAVSDRPSNRLLAFDDRGLRGRVAARSGDGDWAREAVGETVPKAFAGIHVISPEFFDALDEDGAFSIIPPYLRLAAEGRTILPYHIGDALWLEVGDPQRLERARRLLQRED